MTDQTAAPLLSGLPDPEARPEFYAGVPVKRGLAWLVDVTLVAILSALLLPFTLFIALLFFPLLMMCVGFFYRWATLSWWSATPGMWLAGIELREGDGAPLRSGTAMAHTLGYEVSVAIFPLQLASAAMMLLGPRGQGLSDALLGTAAINRPLPGTLSA
ncbi:RDD family protein [Pseudoroseicyclus aestuarii]|uniref:RDD family protein n=1 Tax=Pseudoroseicyclus aestuarii TaxID=1795041 RepID=A0A318SUQ3_9RHOB|nr:RDD family protein [Pseudoroseicyclus aestuarii]PYE85641.1 RDD family protein [Pseudoroseicyclus aestuarii]